MSQHEIAITKAATLAAPAAVGSAASVTLAGAGGQGCTFFCSLFGLGAEQWAILASVATFAYSGALFYLALPRIIGQTRHYWRRLFGRPDDSDQAGA